MRALILGPALVAGLGSGAAAEAAGTPAGPSCTPATLNNSAVLGGSVTVTPLAGSRDASPGTQISFRGVPARDLLGVSAAGSLTGAHPGRLAAYSQGDGASFLPRKPFAEGERVTVRARLRRARSTVRLLDRFVVARANPVSLAPETVHPGSEVQGFHSRPDLRPPTVAVSAASPQASAGDEFVAPYGGPGQAGPMILDPGGRLLWFKPLPPRVAASSFRVQEYEGSPVLTWWQGDVTGHGFGLGDDVIVDRSYATVAVVKAGNGYSADLHDFQLTGRGTALLTAYSPVQCNLSSVGGPAHGALTDGIFQEVDVRTGLVRFEWTSLDHVAVAESYEPAGKSSTTWPYDFFHINSLNADADGGVLVSARNTWAVYDVDGRSGKVIWRLGGRRSTFAPGHGTRTAWQHDPRPLPDGAISVFDNGASPRVRSQSRGVVLRMDGGSRRVVVVSQFTHSPPLLAESQGNMQALPNGDWFVGWGQLPYFSEYGPQGEMVFDAHLPTHTQSYRSFRFQWTGTPSHRPTLAVQGAGGAATAYATWNGATLVSSWRVLAGPDPASLQVVAQAPRSGFETAVPLPSGTRGPDVAVQAVDSGEHVIGTSATVRAAGL